MLGKPPKESEMVIRRVFTESAELYIIAKADYDQMYLYYDLPFDYSEQTWKHVVWERAWRIEKGFGFETRLCKIDFG